MKEVIKRTESGKTYFNGEGAYQNEFNELWEKLVPVNGIATTLHGELVRAAGRLNYEYFNNGNCNALRWNDYSYCGGEVSEYYKLFIDLISQSVEEAQYVMEMIEDVICSTNDCPDEFSISRQNWYSLMIDLVVEYCITTEDSVIPEWYIERRSNN